MELFSWQGPFYPPNLENSKWLSYYSHVFDFVEIVSSFYRIPNAFMVKNWCKKTPNHFRFTAKFPKVITHDKRLKDVEKELELFFSSMVYLEDKILALLIQLPPSMGIVEGMNRLRDIIPELDKRFRYAVEVRDSSWFQDLAIVFLQITICYGLESTCWNKNSSNSYIRLSLHKVHWR